MQLDLRRFLLFCFRPALPVLFLAVLAPIGSAIAGEPTTGVPAVTWHRLPADDEEPGFRQYPRDFWGRAGFEFVLREVVEGAPARDLFFRAGDRLGIGAQGSYDFDSNDLRAIVSLKLEF